ncbi:hypothetical protein RhiirA5_403208 [Rhizophagus irregularis]|uniref:Uncharacterized protein n=1 Tax=Rhizophagus irregularis TaxID=588596 RepID=A0A2N0P117_9GLOM|nr:hypothetical protein RhiirA5_403208 [Rhizophagus irregularis]
MSPRKLRYINDVIDDSIRDAKVARVFLPGKLRSFVKEYEIKRNHISDLRTNQDHGDEGDNEIIKCQKRYMKPKKIVLIWNSLMTIMTMTLMTLIMFIACLRPVTKQRSQSHLVI